MTQTRRDLSKRPRRESDNEQEMADEDAAVGQRDLYGMLGFRQTAYSSVTTQQWLAVRLIKL